MQLCESHNFVVFYPPILLLHVVCNTVLSIHFILLVTFNSFEEILFFTFLYIILKKRFHEFFLFSYQPNFVLPNEKNSSYICLSATEPCHSILLLWLLINVHASSIFVVHCSLFYITTAMYGVCTLVQFQNVSLQCMQ